MKNNSKTLTIETKKLWITGAILSILASIYPALVMTEWEPLQPIVPEPGYTTLTLFKFTFPFWFVIFFLFVVVFILLCKWQGKKDS